MFHYKKFMPVLNKGDYKLLKADYWRMGGWVMVLGAVATIAIDAAYQYGRTLSAALANTAIENVGVVEECTESLKDISDKIDG